MNEFPTGRIFKQALGLVRAHKLLLALSLLLIWGNVLDLLAILYQENNRVKNSSPSDMSFWVNSNQTQSVAIGIVIVIISIVLLVYYFRARAAIIISVDDLMNRKPLLVKEAMTKGRKYFWPIVELWGKVTGTTIASFLVVSLPIIYLISQGFTYRAVVLGFIAWIILTPVVVFMTFINVFGINFIVLQNMDAKKAMRAAYDLSVKWFWLLIVVAFGVILATVLGFFVTIIATALVVSPFVFLGQMSYDIGGYSMSVPLNALSVLVGLTVFLSVMSVVTAFQQVCWTLVYKELVKPKKTFEAELAEIVPEVAS